MNEVNEIQHVMYTPEDLQEAVAFTIGAFYTLLNRVGMEAQLTVELMYSHVLTVPELTKFQRLLATLWNNQWIDDEREYPELQVKLENGAFIIVPIK